MSVFLRIFFMLSVIIVLPTTQQAYADDQKYHFHLSKGLLEKNIFQIAKTANIQIFFFPEMVAGKSTSQTIYGNYILSEVLSKVLQGTGLVYVMNSDRTIIIRNEENIDNTALGITMAKKISDYEAPSLPRKYDEIVTIGSRRSGRTVTTSSVPIDVFQADTLSTTGYVDINDSFRTLVPSFNAKRLALNDGASFVRPITMRGSSADHVLLLLNGKRRHRSATVMVGTGHATTSGSQGQDFNVIPLIAMKNIEILRDGASTLYGSDAIVGVVNMALKDTANGGEITTHIGRYYQGG